MTRIKHKKCWAIKTCGQQKYICMTWTLTGARQKFLKISLMKSLMAKTIRLKVNFWKKNLKKILLSGGAKNR